MVAKIRVTGQHLLYKHTIYIHTYTHTGNYTSKCVKIKSINSHLHLWSSVKYHISSLIFGVFRKVFQPGFSQNKRKTCHEAILPHVSKVASRWCTIIYLLIFGKYFTVYIYKKIALLKILMGVERIVLSVLGQSAAWFLNDTCGSQNDEDKDDHHNDTNYDHHFDVLPPVFPGNACGCSLERIRLKDRNDPSPIKIRTHTGVYNSGNKLTLHISQSPVNLAPDCLLMTHIKTNKNILKYVLVWTR